jgi:hypothetical protein
MKKINKQTKTSTINVDLAIQLPGKHIGNKERLWMGRQKQRQNVNERAVLI